MARFLVTNGSTFEPFSFEELVKPLAYKQEQHNAAQDAYDSLTMETEALANYISDNEDDVEAKALYNNYRNRLAALQENLWQNGVTPQTRRDLAVARKGYAGDIQRLGKAIERRQALSKTYWDAAHKNPDLILGNDPGSFGLDNYLHDDNFGNDWFSYSGNQFMSEVGADAKSKALEYRRNVRRKTEVPGYITRIVDRGFTNDEIEGAIAAVQNGTYKDLKDGATKILADTLAKHITATGAIKGQNISEEQYNRFFGYGRTGLSMGVIEPDVKDFTDLAYKAGLSNNGRRGAAGNQKPAQGQIVVNVGAEPLESPGFREYANTHAKLNKNYANGQTVGIKTIDGKVVVANDVWQATELLYNSPARKKAREFFGSDIALPGENFFGTTKSKQQIYLTATDGTKVHLTTDDMWGKDAKRLKLDELASKYGFDGYDDFVGLYNAQGKLDEDATYQYNKLRLSHEKYVADMKKLNPNLDFDDYAISPKKERELREEYAKNHNLGSNVQSEDFATMIQKEHFMGNFTPASYVSIDEGDNKIRSNAEKNIYTNFGKLVASYGEDGKLKEGSPYSVKVLGPGLMKVQQELYSIEPIFGTKHVDGEDTHELLQGKLNTVDFNLRDIAADPHNPQFRFTTITNPSVVYQANSALLGNAVTNALLGKEYNGVSVNGNINGVTTPTEAIAYMMQPFTDAGSVLQMSSDQARDWYQNTCAYLGIDYNSAIDAKTFVRNGGAASQLLNRITEYLNNHLALAQDAINFGHPAYASYTSKDGTRLQY